MEKISGALAIKTYFDLKAGEALKEIRSLKEAGYFEWFAQECAREMGKQLDTATPAAA
jgi:tRNA U54 and U55 pseudouridine synthase Pus10